MWWCLGFLVRVSWTSKWPRKRPMRVWSSNHPARLTRRDRSNHLRTELPCIFRHASVPVSHSIFHDSEPLLDAVKTGPTCLRRRVLCPPTGRKSSVDYFQVRGPRRHHHSRPVQRPSVGRCFSSVTTRSHVLEHPWVSRLGSRTAFGRRVPFREGYPVHSGHRSPLAIVLWRGGVLRIDPGQSHLSFVPASHPPHTPRSLILRPSPVQLSPAPRQGVVHEGRQASYQ